MVNSFRSLDLPVLSWRTARKQAAPGRDESGLKQQLEPQLNHSSRFTGLNNRSGAGGGNCGTAGLPKRRRRIQVGADAGVARMIKVGVVPSIERLRPELQGKLYR